MLTEAEETVESATDSTGLGRDADGPTSRPLTGIDEQGSNILPS